MSAPADTTSTEIPKKRDAFTELMSSKSKLPKPTAMTDLAREATSSSSPSHSRRKPDGWRNAFSAYVADPAAFTPLNVIYHTSDFVVLRDRFPKASIHLLILTRDAKKSLLHPFDAFTDPIFLASVRAEAEKVQSLAASELRRLFGSESESDRERIAALASDVPPDQLPDGRNWASELMVGIHAVPSLQHLHVHVISKDRHSDTLKHRKHYNSFSTGFFVPLADFPLAEDDPRRHPGREGYLSSEFVCWRCGRNFGSKFAQLKKHLADEFEEWKRE
jgi:aprataxin